MPAALVTAMGDENHCGAFEATAVRAPFTAVTRQ
jgi:hypothetical protein